MIIKKKKPKKPRKFGKKKAIQQSKRYVFSYQSNTTASQRLDIGAINFFDEMSPGFKEWYMESYDENGKYIGEKIPGLFG